MKTENKQFEYSETTQKAVVGFAKWFTLLLVTFCMAIGIVNAFVPTQDAELKKELDEHGAISQAFTSSQKALCDNESSISLHILETQKSSLTPVQKQCYAQKAQWTCPNDYDATLNCSNLK